MSAVPKPSNKHIVRVKEGGQLRTFAVSKDEFLIGRDERADVRIPNTDVSGKHLYIKIIDGMMVQLRDPGSTNGTFVNGQRLEANKEVILSGLNDEIRLGKVATVNVTPGSLQPAPRTPPPSRLSVVKPSTPPPAPRGMGPKASVPAYPAPAPTYSDDGNTQSLPNAGSSDLPELEASRMLIDASQPSISTEPEPEREIVPESNRESIAAKMARFKKPEPKIKLDPPEEPEEYEGEDESESAHEAAHEDPVMADLSSVALTPPDDLDFSSEQAEALQASAMAQEAAKAAQAAQEAAKAAQAAHERAKAAQAAREKAKAEKARLEAEAREKARQEAMAREREKAEVAAAEARARAKAAQEAEEAAKAAQIAHEKAKLKAAADDAVQATLTLQKTARLEIEAFKKKAIADIELVQAEAAAAAENLRLEGYKEAEEARQKAWKEIEALREEVKHEIQALKSAGKIEIDNLHESARIEADSARAQGQRDAEVIKDDGRRECEYLRAQVKKEVEMLNAEGERLKKESEDYRADIERLKDDSDKLRTDIEELKGKQREESGRLASLKQESESTLKNFEIDKIQAEAALREVLQRKDAVNTEHDQIRQKVLEAANLRDTLVKERVDVEQKIANARMESEQYLSSLTSQAETLKQEIETLSQDHVERTDRLAEINDAVRTEEDLLKTLQDSLRREREVNDADERRRKAIVDALDAEYKVKRLSIDGQISEIEHKKADVERELSRLRNQQSDAEREVARLKLDAQEFASKLEADTADQVAEILDDAERKSTKAKSDADSYASKIRTEADSYASKIKSGANDEGDKIRDEADAYAAKVKAECDARTAEADRTIANFDQDVQAAKDKRDRLKAEAQKIQDDIKEQENACAIFKKKTEDAKRDTVAAQEELRKAQAEADEFKKDYEAKLAEMRSDAERSASKVREQVDEEIERHRKDAMASIDRDAEQRREAVKIEFAEKGKIMQREIADAKSREMRVIQQMQEDEQKAQRARLEATLTEIVDRTMELGRQKPIDQAKNELRTAIKAVLEGKASITLSVEAEERSKKFWKKIGIRTSIPVGLLLIYVLFPSIPAAIKERFLKTVAQQKNESGVFLDQIKQRGLKYQPDMDRNYRGSYADNILFLENYVEMKLSEKEQKEWTLVLNDFIVGRLGLSDRIIPDFMSAETVLVQDLMRIREGMMPQFKDQGMARLSDTERAGADKLINLLQSPENYQKFRVFEKDYYESYLKRTRGSR